MTLIARPAHLRPSTNDGAKAMENTSRTRPDDTPWRIVVWGGLASLLLVPLVAMQFTDEVAWTGFDFLVASVLLGVVGAGLEMAMRLSRDWIYRAAFAVAVGAGFLTIWVNLAVGMIGAEDNPANLVFLWVLMVATIGAIIARFRADGMAFAMASTAAAQAGAGGYAVWLGEPRDAVFISFFCVFWLISAGLFRLSVRASRA
jgi:hypothetical protein